MRGARDRWRDALATPALVHAETHSTRAPPPPRPRSRENCTLRAPEIPPHPKCCRSHGHNRHRTQLGISRLDESLQLWFLRSRRALTRPMGDWKQFYARFHQKRRVYTKSKGLDECLIV